MYISILFQINTHYYVLLSLNSLFLFSCQICMYICFCMYTCMYQELLKTTTDSSWFAHTWRIKLILILKNVYFYLNGSHFRVKYMKINSLNNMC